MPRRFKRYARSEALPDGLRPSELIPRRIAIASLAGSCILFLLADGVREGLDRVAHHGPHVLKHGAYWLGLHLVLVAIPFATVAALLMVLGARLAVLGCRGRVIRVSASVLLGAWVASHVPASLDRFPALRFQTEAAVYAFASFASLAAAYLVWPGRDVVVGEGRRALLAAAASVLLLGLAAARLCL